MEAAIDPPPKEARGKPLSPQPTLSFLRRKKEMAAKAASDAEQALQAALEAAATVVVPPTVLQMQSDSCEARSNTTSSASAPAFQTVSQKNSDSAEGAAHMVTSIEQHQDLQPHATDANADASTRSKQSAVGALFIELPHEDDGKGVEVAEHAREASNKAMHSSEQGAAGALSLHLPDEEDGGGEEAEHRAGYAAAAQQSKMPPLPPAMSAPEPLDDSTRVLTRRNTGRRWSNGAVELLAEGQAQLKSLHAKRADALVRRVRRFMSWRITVIVLMLATLIYSALVLFDLISGEIVEPACDCAANGTGGLIVPEWQVEFAEMFQVLEVIFLSIFQCEILMNVFVDGLTYVFSSVLVGLDAFTITVSLPLAIWVLVSSEDSAFSFTRLLRFARLARYLKLIVSYNRCIMLYKHKRSWASGAVMNVLKSDKAKLVWRDTGQQIKLSQPLQSAADAPGKVELGSTSKNGYHIFLSHLWKYAQDTGNAPRGQPT